MDFPFATRNGARFIGPVLGRYALGSWISASGVQIFACRSQSISRHQLIATGPVIGDIGETVTAHFLPFGTVRGLIVRHIEDGFVVDIDATAEDRKKLGAKIDWYKKRVFSGVTDKRQHRRFMPREPRSAVVLADGSLLPCFIINMSASGAAISADIDPARNTPVAIGKVLARVVRKLEVGFAVQFVETLPADGMENMLQAPEEWARALRAVHAPTWNAVAEVAVAVGDDELDQLPADV